MIGILPRNANLLVLTAACTFGCGVSADEQTLRLRYDLEHDRLNVLVVTRGLYTQGYEFDKATRDKVAGEWVDAIERGDRCLVVTFFPHLVNLDTPATTADDEERARDPLLRAISVKHGDLFLDDRGRPSLWQLLRIDHLSSVLARLNQLLGERLRDEAQEATSRQPDQGVFPDERTMALWKATAGNEFAFLAMRGNALSLRMPLSKVGHRYQLEQLVGDASHETSSQGRWLADCLTHEWSLIRTGEITELVLGNPESREQAFDMPTAGSYLPNLLAVLERRQVPVAPQLDEAKMLRAFDEFCGQ